MDRSNSKMARDIAQAASAFEELLTGHAPQSVTLVWSENTLVVTLHGALSPAEKALAQNSAGARQVQEFHRQLFACSSDQLREEIQRITGVEVCEATAEVEITTGTVVQVFTSGTLVRGSCSAKAWLLQPGPAGDMANHHAIGGPTMLVSSRNRKALVAVRGSEIADGRQLRNNVVDNNISSEASAVGQLRLLISPSSDEPSQLAEVASVRQHLQSRYSFQNVVTKSPSMFAIFDLIGRVAQTAATVLIEGETGTGKEEIARAIHQASRTRSGPLVAVACAALPEQLLESELFGHEKGAFTSAARQHKGRFELAQGGTLFLDEVGDLSEAMQCKLLRVLQERRFERVGGSQSLAMDVRVVAATNRCLRKMVRKGKFREDLYYRLNVVKIDLPPLRARPEDIPLLAVHFTEKYASPNEPPKRLAGACWEPLLRYRWPGNVRQLENAIQRACIATRGDLVQPEDLPAEVVQPTKEKTRGFIDFSRPLPEVLARIELKYLLKAMQRSKGNIGQCARLCGLCRPGLIAKLADYEIDTLEFEKA
ncbi:hypothetical protein AYO44_05900 [Planctomycetaceae bacterium SCGC AG-212-F19]|nr:hypothetical protein AYO44_05900 [Planctomycetaceae bacterium SCGC AG-212-F19]